MNNSRGPNKTTMPGRGSFTFVKKNEVTRTGLFVWRNQSTITLDKQSRGRSVKHLIFARAEE